MNLLFLAPQLPYPPRQGTAIRNWGLIKSLSARHTISLLTFAGPDNDPAAELSAACQRIETVAPPRRSRAGRLVSMVTSPLPDLAHRLRSAAFTDRLAGMLAQATYQAIVIEGLELAGLVTAGPSIRTIFDAHNCETLLQRRAFQSDRRRPVRWPAALYSWIQSRRLARYEAAICRRASHVTCVSAEDGQALSQLAPGLKPVVLPNGIFLNDYDARQFPGPDPSAPAIVFTGKMDYRPNVDAVLWFADAIFPVILRSLPRAHFVIVGQQPVTAISRLAGRRGITVTGGVPDARPYIAAAAVYVAPLRMGGGTRFKLLEAMALGRPIVSTRLGAEGFDVRDGRDLCLADEGSAFAAAVLNTLEERSRAAALGAAGREFARSYDWSRIVPVLENLLAGGADLP
jgi:sugar transferase (PEP-CTERM/EpsH1 system associated)